MNMNMNKLFYNLTSGIPYIRKANEFLDGENIAYTLSSPDPLKKVKAWVLFKRKPGILPNPVDDSYNRLLIRQKVKEPAHKAELLSKIRNANHIVYSLVYELGNWTAVYTFSPWIPTKVDRRLLPFQICSVGRSNSLLQSPDRKAGLSDISRRTSRIKSLGFEQMLIYSYLYDTRFVFTLSLIIGISVWWYTAPEPLLLNPKAIFLTPDPNLLTQVVKDTYINQICSQHLVPSPCDCGEHLNTVARDLIKEPPEFDPLHNNKRDKIKGIALLAGSIILSLALSESVSKYGVLVSFT